ncbi:MAG: HlyD family efflux transporter periplasmic adaptor subunit [Coprococcus sp.]
MVLRKETVVNAEKSGYVNYFVDDAQKVALGTNIYTITSSKLETQTDQDSNEEVSLNADEWNSILLKAQGFNESYSPGGV